MEERTGKSKVVELHEAASLLDLSADAVRSLTAAGYLAPADHNGEPRYALGDLKAFVARNADDGSGIVWDDEGDAIRMANDTHYGLAAYIWSNDITKALRTAHAVEAGWVQINQGSGQVVGQPYGGFKESGLGRENSLEGMLESFTQRKSVTINLNY